MHKEDRIIPASLRQLSDTEFHHQFEQIAFVEHTSTMKMLHFINDLERRRSYLDLGYSSVFDYCVRKIGYSRSAAGRRIQAARCARRYPQVFAMLRTREVSLGTVALIEPILTDDNKDSILERVRGAAHREVERVVSEYRPPVAFRDRLQYVRVPVSEPKDIDAALFDRECAQAVPEVWRNRITTEEKVFVQFLADEEFLKIFEEVRAMISNAHEQSFADVMKAVLTEYRDRHSPTARRERREARKGSASLDSRRREWNDGTQSRHIPDEIRDEVRVRDGGRCSFVAPDGTRCQCTKGLQIDHIRPYAAGGAHEPSNLRLLCGAHNRRAAEQTLGSDVMSRYWRRQQASSSFSVQPYVPQPQRVSDHRDRAERHRGAGQHGR